MTLQRHSTARRTAGLRLGVLATLATMLGAACSSTQAIGDVDPARILSSDLHPTPYSAEEIRLGNPPGTGRVYLVTQGGQSHLEHTEFLAHPEGLARFAQTSMSLDGEAMGDAAHADATWEELQAHASYPRIDTTLTEETCTTAAGTFDAWLYRRIDQAREDAPPMQHSVWFAKDLPGAPVLYELTTEGALVFRMELIETRGAPVTSPTSD